MRSIRRSAVQLAVVALLAPTLPCVLGAQALPAARDLMEKSDAAMGGRAALEKHTSMHMTGNLSVPAAGMEATVDVFRSKDGKFVQKMVLGPLGEVLSGYDGKTAWAVQPQTGPMIIPDSMAKQIKQQSDFFGNLHDMSRYSSAETVELADFDGRKCYKVKLVRTDGDTGFEYFDAATGLVAGRQTSANTPMGKIDQVSTFDDYKDFDGVEFPTKITSKTGQMDATITFTSVAFDKVDPATFALPESVKALVKP